MDFLSWVSPASRLEQNEEIRERTGVIKTIFSKQLYIYRHVSRMGYEKVPKQSL